MADPNDVLTEFDLLDEKGQPSKQASLLARARAMALRNQQGRAIAAQLSGVPELEAIGKADYEQAGREREDVARQGASVLNRALQQKQYEREISALNLQGEQIRGQLDLAQKGLQLQAMEPFIRSMLEATTEEEKIKALTSHFGPLGQKLGEVLSGPAQAKAKAAGKVLQQTESVVGGKTPKVPTEKKPAEPKTPAAAANQFDAWRQKYGATAKTE